METTVISDAVNTTSRIEDLTKHYHTPLLISMNAWLELDETNSSKARLVDIVKLKGKQKTTSIFEVLEGQDEQIAYKKFASAKQFERAVRYFDRGSYIAAHKIFERIYLENSDDYCCEIYLEKCLICMASQTNWEAV